MPAGQAQSGEQVRIAGCDERDHGQRHDHEGERHGRPAQPDDREDRDHQPQHVHASGVRVNRDHDQGDPLDVDGGQRVVVEVAVRRTQLTISSCACS